MCHKCYDHHRFAQGISKNRPETTKKNNLRWRLKQYGLTPIAFDAILQTQNGGCAICGAKTMNSVYQRLGVDHSHATGKIRGLLCGSCNAGLGSFKDDPILLEQAVTYIRKHESMSTGEWEGVVPEE